MLQALTTSEFDRVTGTGTAVVDFWAPWCVYCPPMQRVVEQVSADHPGATFGQVNVDDEPALAARLRVNGLPTVVVLRDGHEVGRLTGVQPAARLQALLSAH